MPTVDDRPLAFKFQWLNDQGQPTGLFRKKGRFDGSTLVLGETEIPVPIIVNVLRREGRLVISAMTPEGTPAHLAIVLSQSEAERLKTAIDIARSATWAQWHRENLEQQGRGHTYRDSVCPRCGATLVLSKMPNSPQLYCHFCDSLSTVEPPQAAVPGESHLRICDECGLFSKPRKFTIFYFYFLLVVYGWQQRTTWRCPACMRGDAWKMLFGNLLFVLGVPVALVQLVRSYGSGIVGGAFAGLDGANLKVRRGDIGGALDGYRRILEHAPQSAGVKYNLAVGLLKQGDSARAAEMLELALHDCSNYVPAYQALQHCYEQLGETSRLAELRETWDEEKGEDEEHGQPGETITESQMP